MWINELYGDQYDGIDLRVFGDRETHILWEQMGDFLYLHELRNSKRNMAGLKLITKFIKEHQNIVCSTIRDKIATVARRYGFDIYKRIDDRLFMIRRK